MFVFITKKRIVDLSKSKTDIKNRRGWVLDNHLKITYAKLQADRLKILGRKLKKALKKQTHKKWILSFPNTCSQNFINFLESLFDKLSGNV